MQLKKIFLIISLSLCLFTAMSRSIKAECDFDCAGRCNNNCGYVTCTTGAYICDLENNTCGGECACDPGYVPIINCTESIDPNLPYWEATSGTYCQTDCELGFGCGCIQETATLYCGPCESLTPTPNPEDPNPTSVPSSIISGRIGADEGAAVSGPFCYQTNLNTLSFAGWNVSVTNTAAPSQTYTTNVSGSNFSVNTVSGGHTFTVTLDLSAQAGTNNYVCSCPAPLNPNNPYLCQYTGVVSPNSTVNFYLKEYNLSNDSWFQVFGGNYFARNGIASSVPYAFCSLDANCRAALSVSLTGSSNQNNSGFPVVTATNANSILSTNIVGYSHAYLHLAQRVNNLNSYAVSTDLNQLSYSYFHKLVENNLQEIGDGEDLEPLLSDWTNASWWQNDEVNYIKVYGNVGIDETQGFNLSSGQKLVLFVDGNLILDDSNTNDANRKITSVAPGGFLAFFVSGDIIITADVGYELNPSLPTVPVVSNANSNLEGVFVANNNLLIQSKTAIGEVPPDRKFIGAGTFVGWNNVLLNRTFNDNSFGPILNNNQAIENFIYRGDLLANWPVKLRASTSNWREVDPQFINQ